MIIFHTSRLSFIFSREFISLFEGFFDDKIDPRVKYLYALFTLILQPLFVHRVVLLKSIILNMIKRLL